MAEAKDDRDFRPVWDGQLIKITRNKGKIPAELSGKYTDMSTAQRAIDYYNEHIFPTKRQKPNAKPKAEPKAKAVPKKEEVTE